MATDEAKRPATALRIKVRHTDVDQFVDRFAINVARSGLFIPTRQPKPVGSEVRFEIRLATDQAVLVGQGVVRWIREGDPANPRALAGMAVELQRVSRESRDLLLRMLEVRKQRGLPDPAGGIPAEPDDEPITAPRTEAVGTTEVKSAFTAEAKKDEDTTQVRSVVTARPAAAASDDEGKTQIRAIPTRRPTPTPAPVVPVAPPTAPATVARARTSSAPPVRPAVTNDSPTRIGPMPVHHDSPTRIGPMPPRPTLVPEPIAPTPPPPPRAAPPPEPEPEPEPIVVPAAAAPPHAPALPAGRAARTRRAPAELMAATAAAPGVDDARDELDDVIDVAAVVARARALASATGDLEAELDALVGGVVVDEVSIEDVSLRLASALGTSAATHRVRSRGTPSALPVPSLPVPVPVPVPVPDPGPATAPAPAAPVAAMSVDTAAVAVADAVAEAGATSASHHDRGVGATTRGRRPTTMPPPRPRPATAELRAHEDRLARERAERERVERDRLRAERDRLERDRLRAEREEQERERLRREHDERERARLERERNDRAAAEAREHAVKEARERAARDEALREQARREHAATRALARDTDPLAALDLDDGLDDSDADGVDVDLSSGAHALRSRDIDLGSVPKAPRVDASSLAADALGARELKTALTPVPEPRSVPHAGTRPVSRTTPPPPPPPRHPPRPTPMPVTPDPVLDRALAGLDLGDDTGRKPVAPTPRPDTSIPVDLDDDDLEIEIDIDVDE